MTLAHRSLLLPVFLCAIAACAQQTPPPTSDAGTAQSAPTTPLQQAPASQPATGAAQSQSALPDMPQAIAPPVITPTGPTAVFDTSMGQMRCRLFSKEAPNTVANFIGLAEGTKEWTNPQTHRKEHHVPLYNGTTFHRVIPGFMIQAGDPVGDGTGDPGYYINDEIVPGLDFDVPGRLAMANSGPNTDGSQFFITVAAYPTLNGNYSIFGQCDDASVTVANAIAAVDRDANDKPLTPVVLTKVLIIPVGEPIPAAPSTPAASQAATPASAPSNPQ